MVARKHRTHLPMAGDSQASALAPKHLTKQEFARRLYNLMIGAGFKNQSDLARAADMERDKVSVYIRGKSLPTPANVTKLAKVFGIKDEELLPNYQHAAIDEDMPAFEMKVSTSDTSMALLRVNRIVRTSTAVKIAELLQADDVLNRVGSGDAASMQREQG